MKQKTPSKFFIENESAKIECQKMVESHAFKKLVSAAYDRLGPYKVSTGFSEYSHIQDRVDGGSAAVLLFIKELMTLPYKESLEEEDDNEMRFIDPIDAINSTLV